MASFDLTGRTALARAGARVVLAARHADEVEAAATQLREAGAEVIGVPANVSKAQDIETLALATEAAFGQVDILVNNAATNVHFGPVLDADDGMWLKMVETNLLSAVRLCRRVVPGMRTRRWGKIVNVASVAGIQPGIGQGVYAAVKAVLIQRAN